MSERILCAVSVLRVSRGGESVRGKMNSDALREDVINARKQVAEKIDCYDPLFEKFGVRCPLKAQQDSVIKKGFRPLPDLIKALLAVELSKGVLMGVQDYSRVSGVLGFRLAVSGETFMGMRKQVVCHEDEPIIEDDLGIIASYVQGPDIRTMTQGDSEELLILAFGSPRHAKKELIESIDMFGSLLDMEKIIPTEIAEGGL